MVCNYIYLFLFLMQAFRSLLYTCNHHGSVSNKDGLPMAPVFNGYSPCCVWIDLTILFPSGKEIIQEPNGLMGKGNQSMFLAIAEFISFFDHNLKNFSFKWSPTYERLVSIAVDRCEGSIMHIFPFPMDTFSQMVRVAHFFHFFPLKQQRSMMYASLFPVLASLLLAASSHGHFTSQGLAGKPQERRLISMLIADTRQNTQVLI